MKIKVAVFKCKWFTLSQVKIDKYGETYVNLIKMTYNPDPFILVSYPNFLCERHTLHKN